jgi:hypothetical protein
MKMGVETWVTPPCFVAMRPSDAHTNQTSKYFSIRKPQICINDSWKRKNGMKGNGRKGRSPELNISLGKEGIVSASRNNGQYRKTYGYHLIKSLDIASFIITSDYLAKEVHGFVAQIFLEC